MGFNSGLKGLNPSNHILNATSTLNKLQIMLLGSCVYYITEDTIYNTVRNITQHCSDTVNKCSWQMVNVKLKNNEEGQQQIIFPVFNQLEFSSIKQPVTL
jgi:hypothetical protein